MILPESKTEIVRHSNKVVYGLGDKIAKVFNENKPVSDVFNEALNLARINEADIRSPKALEVSQVEGRWLGPAHLEGSRCDPRGEDERRAAALW